MKRILAVLSVLVLALSFAACGSKNNGTVSGVYDPDAVTQNPTVQKQNDVIAENFGVSVENKRIVGYVGEDDFVRYIIIEYDDAGNYRKGQEHYLYHSADAYDAAISQYGDAVIEHNDDALYLSVASGFAGTNYDEDFEKLDKLYRIKTRTGVQ